MKTSLCQRMAPPNNEIEAYLKKQNMREDIMKCSKIRETSDGLADLGFREASISPSFGASLWMPENTVFLSFIEGGNARKCIWRTNFGGHTEDRENKKGSGKSPEPLLSPGGADRIRTDGLFRARAAKATFERLLFLDC
ncbi:MAG: hypothetical protein LBS45_11970 [Synergistaceae bacterium]|nr:hypothetical protein [Synergistaceae bacterium]